MSPVQAGGLRVNSPLPHFPASCPVPSIASLFKFISGPPSCLPFSHSLPYSSPPVGHSLPDLFPFRLWGGSWAAWVMEVSLGVTREKTVQTALRRAREGRREEGTWDPGDEGEACTRLPGTSGEPCPVFLLWGPPSDSLISAPR